MPTINALSHVTLTVTDVEASVAWYAKALGMRRGPDMSGPGWRRTLMLAQSGVIIGLQAHDRTPDKDRFDEARVGLDHISIACKDRTEVEPGSLRSMAWKYRTARSVPSRRTLPLARIPMGSRSSSLRHAAPDHYPDHGTDDTENLRPI